MFTFVAGSRPLLPIEGSSGDDTWSPTLARVAMLKVDDDDAEVMG